MATHQAPPELLPAEPNGSNGNGILSKLSKTSWIWVMVIGFGSAGIASHFQTQQALTVQGATLQLQITDLKAQVDELRRQNLTMVPKEVHEARWEMEREVNHWKELYYESEIRSAKRKD